jgi:uncharacterized protein
MNDEAKALIARFGLEPLPEEGGFFRRTWSSSAQLAGGRGAGSAIMFLLTDTDFSAIHRLTTDELWFFHAGDSVEHVQFSSAQPAPVVTRLGADLLDGEMPQHVVRGGQWQGARLLRRDREGMESSIDKGWALISCFMAPAWDQREFTLGARDPLLQEFPRAADWIRALTR